jgi:hypothetical protein
MKNDLVSEEFALSNTETEQTKSVCIVLLNHSSLHLNDMSMSK